MSAILESDPLKAGAPLDLSHCVAFTFDDGPHRKNTARLLDIAKAHQVKFTFFVIGERVACHGSLLVRMRDEGHEIGNHTWSHVNLDKLSDQDLLNEVGKCHHEMIRVTGLQPKLFRPPYGKLNRRQQALISNHFGYEKVLWNIDTIDWRIRNAPTIHTHLMEVKLANSVVLMHDIFSTSIDATELLLNDLDGGVRFVTVSELRNSISKS